MSLLAKGQTRGKGTRSEARLIVLAKTPGPSAGASEAALLGS